jgi:hypothetical protein
MENVIESAADQMFNDIKPDMTSRMSQYKGDLELITSLDHHLGVRVNESLYVRTRDLAKSLDGSRPTSGSMTLNNMKTWKESGIRMCLR